MGESDLKLGRKKTRLALLDCFPNYPKELTPRYWDGNYSDRARQSERNTARRRGVNRPPDFISKIEGSLQELEESEYWLELLGESGFCPAERLLALKKETES